MYMLADIVRATDEHASHHLALWQRAERLLAGSQTESAEQRRRLAHLLERWRYQYINQQGTPLSAEARLLVDALDAVSNWLAARSPRPARNPRGAIFASDEDTADIEQATRCLMGQMPLADAVQQAAALTRQHFAGASDAPGGHQRCRILMYAPLYLSSHCINHCTYCGFRYPQDIARKHLSPDEAIAQAEILRSHGFKHILLVAGDFPRLTTTDYYVAVIGRLAAMGVKPSVEIAPQDTASYERIFAAKAVGVTLYQETYNESLYAQYHPRGSKASYDWRLEGPDRAAEAGAPRLGLGILLGLADPREELLCLMRHGRYLAQRFPDRTLAFSLPRIHDAPREFRAAYSVDDELFVRMYCALRIAFPRAELVLSTREAPALRDRLAQVCITQMSAGSSTTPGGYGGDADGQDRNGQFPVSDHRTPEEVVAQLRGDDREPVWDLG